MKYDELLAEASHLGVKVRERELSPGRCGCYYAPGRLIIIDETLPDFARRETALRLINPTEYAIAERMYEGDSFLIAQALDVTVQVVEDYKEMLHDSVAV